MQLSTNMLRFWIKQISNMLLLDLLKESCWNKPVKSALLRLCGSYYCGKSYFNTVNKQSSAVIHNKHTWLNLNLISLIKWDSATTTLELISYDLTCGSICDSKPLPVHSVLEQTAPAWAVMISLRSNNFPVKSTHRPTDNLNGSKPALLLEWPFAAYWFPIRLRCVLPSLSFCSHFHL